MSLNRLAEVYINFFGSGLEMQQDLLRELLIGAKRAPMMGGVTVLATTIILTMGATIRLQRWMKTNRNNKYGFLFDIVSYSFPLAITFVTFPLACWWPVIGCSALFTKAANYYLD